MNTAGIIVAAGSSQRFSGGGLKQLLLLAGVPMATWSARALATVCDIIVVAAPPGREDEVRSALSGIAGIHAVVTGGETRQDSVFNALEALPVDATHVLIHDAARPCASAELIARIAAALEGHDAVVPVIPAVDTLVRETGERVEAILDRAHIAGVQTPQAFACELILEAHRAARKRGLASSDDGSLVLALGRELTAVPGERTNIKVTYPEDVVVAEAILRDRSST